MSQCLCGFILWAYMPNECKLSEIFGAGSFLSFSSESEEGVEDEDEDEGSSPVPGRSGGG